MHLSSLVVFAAFALWASASPIDDSVLRRGIPLEYTPLNQPKSSTNQLSRYNAYISWGSLSGGRHCIYVTAFDGKPVRTYIVDSDEEQYFVIHHLYQRKSDTIMHDTIMHYNYDGKQETYVLMSNNGLRTYTMLNRKTWTSYDPNARIITYVHEVNGKKYTREIGFGGQPVKTVIRLRNGQSNTVLPKERSPLHREKAVKGELQAGELPSQAGTDEVSQYNAHISWGWHGGQHHIYVNAFDGKPVRTYIVDADEKQYIVINHSYRSTKFTIAYLSGSRGQVTKVLGPNGLLTYIERNARIEDNKEPAKHTTKYNDVLPDGKKYFRQLGSLGQPVKTEVHYPNGQVDSFEPKERPIHH